MYYFERSKARDIKISLMDKAIEYRKVLCQRFASLPHENKYGTRDHLRIPVTLNLHRCKSIS